MPRYSPAIEVHQPDASTNRPSRGDALTAVVGLQGPLFFWSYVYYLSKYYELLDTALLVIKVAQLGLAG